MQRKGSPTSPRRVWNLRSEWSCYQIVPPRHRQNGHGVRFSMDGKSWKIFEVRTTVTGDLKDLKRAWDIRCRLSKYLERTLKGRMEMISWRNSWESVNFGMWLLTLKRLGPKPLIDWWKNPRFFVLGQLVSGNFWDPQQRVEDSDFMWLCFNKISMVFLDSKQVSNSKSPAFLRSLIEKSINRPRHVRSFRWKSKKIQNCPGVLTPWWQHSGAVPQRKASPVFTPVPTAKMTGNPGIFTWHIRQRFKRNKILNKSLQVVIHAGWHPSHAKDSLEIQRKHGQVDVSFANQANLWGVNATLCSKLSFLKKYNPLVSPLRCQSWSDTAQSWIGPDTRKRTHFAHCHRLSTHEALSTLQTAGMS